MKTEITVISGYPHAQIGVGSKGYIDGYVSGGDGIPYAVVVCDTKIDFIPINAIECTGNFLLAGR